MSNNKKQKNTQNFLIFFRNILYYFFYFIRSYSFHSLVFWVSGMYCFIIFQFQLESELLSDLELMIECESSNRESDCFHYDLIGCHLKMRIFFISFIYNIDLFMTIEIHIDEDNWMVYISSIVHRVCMYLLSWS